VSARLGVRSPRAARDARRPPWSHRAGRVPPGSTQSSESSRLRRTSKTAPVDHGGASAPSHLRNLLRLMVRGVRTDNALQRSPNWWAPRGNPVERRLLVRHNQRSRRFKGSKCWCCAVILNMSNAPMNALNRSRRWPAQSTHAEPGRCRSVMDPAEIARTSPGMRARRTADASRSLDEQEACHDG